MSVVIDNLPKDAWVAGEMIRRTNLPKVYKFGYMDGDNLRHVSICAKDEDEARRFFYHLSNGQHYDTTGFECYLDFITPDLFKYFKDKVGKELIDAFFKFHEEEERRKKAAELKAVEEKKAKRAKQKELEKEAIQSEMFHKFAEWAKALGMKGNGK